MKDLFFVLFALTFYDTCLYRTPSDDESCYTEILGDDRFVFLICSPFMLALPGLEFLP